MKKYYQKPQSEYVVLTANEPITADDTELGVESNPFLAAVLEDEAAEQ